MRTPTIAAALALCACQSPCEKAIDHNAHLSWVETQRTNAAVLANPEVAKAMPTERDMLPTMREIGRKRFGALCDDPGFTTCVLAATTTGQVSKCQHPEWFLPDGGAR